MINRLAILLVLGSLVACDRGPVPVNIPETRPIGMDVESIMEAATEEGEACVWQPTPTCGQEAYCLTYQDSPAQPEARCIPREEEGISRLLGTVWDFGQVLAEGEMIPVTEGEVRFAPALLAASNIDGAWDDPLAQIEIDDEGRFDTSADLTDSALGVVAIIEGEGYYRSANAVAIPLNPQPEGCFGCYGPANTLHDAFMVSESLLNTWSESLASEDDYVTERLPLGDQGGVVGFVRRMETGKGLENARLVSATGGMGRVYYLNEDLETFNTDATTSTGAFVIVGPSLAEGFDVEYEGKLILPRTNLAGSTPYSTLFMLMNIREDYLD